MNLFKILFGLFLLSTVTACERKEKPEVKQPAAEHQHELPNSSIELNNGVRWQTNPEMAPSIKKMDELISAAANTADPDYKALSANLSAEISVLTKNCTMQGRSHEELHKWLSAYIESVKKLSAADKATAPAAFNNVQNSFYRFYEFFE